MFYNQVFIDKKIFDLESIKSKKQDKITERLGHMIIDLIRNILHSSRYNIKDIQGEVYYEAEMYIIEKFIIKYLKKYDSTKGNGFSLASSMVINLTYDFLRKLKTRDALGKPKYLSKLNVFTKEKDRIIVIYLDDNNSIDKIY